VKDTSAAKGKQVHCTYTGKEQSTLLQMSF